ncbi:hypothetical protein [Pseudobacteriovorax antillogorgiicola]|uniref:Peptidase C1A papain C-terminal domain-containing protein n=1 Tax=Pseudobacteriovorax antillogorgiicola TaxID=1513793 RepID=A0A1Y6BD17_9BACT|nr:hypothetical protein [Pseudobacteriovorax antillogorgiicola]TCS58491.1 hypothetical protein EDD56_1024 [Pseudobacteriovorax antillogorgiicola]SME98286.1 hypothetical protein SAMN06296036_102439 [Pseudobacteriovorax antillogorgiicola]
MKITYLFGALVIASTTSFGAAANSSQREFYPSTVPSRIIGLMQGNFGSCAAAAQTHALEHQFALRGYSVRLSNFYSYNYIWRERAEEQNIKVSSTDLDLMEKWGPILPEFMWPEDGAGLFTAYNGSSSWFVSVTGSSENDEEIENHYRNFHVPRVSKAVLHDGIFSNARNLGYKDSFYAYSSRNDIIEFVKENVARDLAPVITVHGDILEEENMNLSTGLSKGYKFEEIDAKEPRHAVVAVGWDNSLYNGEGALIVRNSWNSPSRINAAQEVSDEDLDDFNRFRGKLQNGRKLPGFAAIPFSYIRKVARKYGDFGITIYDIDYRSFYNTYNRSRGAYKTLSVPFACEGSRIRSTSSETEKDRVQFAISEWRDATNLLESGDAFGRVLYRDILFRNALGTRKGADFKIAQVPTHSKFGDKRFDELLRGDFNHFYCYPSVLNSQQGRVWPNNQEMSSGMKSLIKDNFDLGFRNISSWKNFFDRALVDDLDQL